MVNIYINGRFLSQPLSGVQRYALEVTRAMNANPAVLSGSIQLTVLVPEGTAVPDGFCNLKFETVGRGRSPLWEQTSLAIRVGGELLINLSNGGVFGKRRQICVIHDALLYRYPENFRLPYVLYHKISDWMYARRSKLVTVSEFSRAELSSILRVDPRDIIVAGNGAEHMRWLKPDSAILQKLGVEGRKYFLTVGTRSPVKNLEVVVKAVVKSKIDDVLVIVAGSSDGRVFGETIVPNDSRLLLAGRVRDEELLALYQNSEALIFSSHYEGFGIPPLEAMSSGCPVIASDIATLREVCRGAVLYFDPKEPRSLIAAMKSILEENELKSKMIVQGRKHAEIYKWDKTADLILNAAVELAKF